jgi:hypothetical protein
MIGQDQSAINLLKSLDDDKELGQYIDCMRAFPLSLSLSRCALSTLLTSSASTYVASGSLETMRDPAEKWDIVSR